LTDSDSNEIVKTPEIEEVTEEQVHFMVEFASRIVQRWNVLEQRFHSRSHKRKTSVISVLIQLLQRKICWIKQWLIQKKAKITSEVFGEFRITIDAV